MNRHFSVPLTIAATLAGAMLLVGQDIKEWITGVSGKPALAVVDFHSSGSQELMGPFNSTLFSDLQGSALFDMKAKSMYPLSNPQRPEDLRPEDNHQGFALQDWSGAPVNASHLVFGYTAVQNGVLVLYGYVYDARVTNNTQAAQLLANRYTGSVDEAGARKVAHEFANDVIQKFGGTGSLLGSRIYFTSNRTGAEEIWVMDWDGGGQKALTNLKSTSIMPGISPDGTRLAFTSFAKGTPRIYLLNTETARILPFYNQEASLNANPGFTPDGQKIFYSSTASGTPQIYVSSVNGEGFQRVSYRDAIEVEPKVNPKNPNYLIFVSGPGHQQIYRMTVNGSDVERITNGEGEASNPSWNPDGQHIAFSWTSGVAKGDFNVFVMDVSTRNFVQLTHGEGRNENPVWAPDGRHLVFASTRTGRSQIYTMLADGTNVRQLTKDGINRFPVWGTK